MRVPSHLYDLCYITDVLEIPESQLRVGRLPDLAVNTAVAGPDLDYLQMYVSCNLYIFVNTDSHSCPSERHWVSCL